MVALHGLFERTLDPELDRTVARLGDAVQVTSRDPAVSCSVPEAVRERTARKSLAPRCLELLVVMLCVACQPSGPGHPATHPGAAFPTPGESRELQEQRSPSELGLREDIIDELRRVVLAGRWALWRDGYLVHVEGDFSAVSEVKSLAKTVHAAMVGAALLREKIPSLDQPIGECVPGLVDREVTWRHLLTQTSGLHQAGLPPGEQWVYHDSNIYSLCQALACAWGKSSYREDYDEVLANALLDPVGARGWSHRLREDGVRLLMDLEDLGRIGLLMVTGGVWGDRQLLPAHFVRELGSKQTHGVSPRYGVNAKFAMQNVFSGLRDADFPESPYGYMTWVNSDGDLWPEVSTTWALAHGSGGHHLAWDPVTGVVFAALQARFEPTEDGRPGWPLPVYPVLRVLDELTTDVNPLVTRARHASEDLGTFTKWRPVTLTIPGPIGDAVAEANPFAVMLKAEFLSPTGRSFIVPGFFDGDGRGGSAGRVWKIRFSADELGKWTFRTISSNPELDDVGGSFAVDPQSESAPDFYRWGRLERVPDARYLKFRDGPHWLKAGADDPENFLGRLQHYDTLLERVEAVDHLAGHGINSLYVMTHNIDGDGDDVWPWLGNSAEHAKTHAAGDVRFDLGRLREWRKVFEHMQARGVAVHLVLEDDSAWTGFDRRRYYRELIARFGDLPAVLVNLAEEYDENYPLAEALEHVRLFAQLDPYGHPRGIHNVNEPDATYLRAEQIDFASIQTHHEDALMHNAAAIDWLKLVHDLGVPPRMIGFDEARPVLDRRGWWSGYLGGAVWEAHVGEPFDRPMETWKETWSQLGGARAFLETLPFWRMDPCNDSIRAGRAFCLGAVGSAYALYLPEGGEIEMILPEGRYVFQWWAARNARDGSFAAGGELAGGRVTLGAPGPGDWALRIVADSYQGLPPETPARGQPHPPDPAGHRVPAADLP